MHAPQSRTAKHPASRPSRAKPGTTPSPWQARACLQRLTAGVAALSFIVAAGCTASVEDRIKSWEKTQTQAAELKTKYPNFAAVIDAQQKAATSSWDEALKVSDEKEKAEALGQASVKLSKLTGRLREVESKSEMVEDNITKLAKLKLPKSKADQRRDAMDAARSKVDKARTAVREAAPADNTSAMSVLDDQVSMLITANNNIERTIKNLKPKPKKKKKKGKKGKKGRS